MATNYTVNYDDKRFQEVENEEATALREVKGTYDNMINESQGFYQQQIDASKEWANTQSELQQAQTDLAIEKVEQAKDQAEKSYIREQKGAYQDYQEVINPYGVTAEKLAEQGLNNSGYSKTVAINAYNTYQNRYASARESYNQAILNYDNSIKDAQLANNSALAKIAYDALQQQLELSLQGFQYKNQLLLQKVDAVNQTKDRYYQRWQNVQQQINTENALAEQVRQYNESLAEQRRQYNETMAFNKAKQAQDQKNWEKEYALAKSKSSSSGSGSAKKSSSSSKSSTKLTNTKKTSSSNSKLSNSSSKSSSSSTTLSRTANGEYQMAKAAVTFGRKDDARNGIYSAVQGGRISEKEAETIFKKLNL